MRYWLQFDGPEELQKEWCDSLSEVFLMLKDNPLRLCQVGSEDDKEYYQGIESEVKGTIAWKLLNIEPNAEIPSLRRYMSSNN